MKVLAGAHAPDEGEMRLDGDPYAPRDPMEGRRRGVAMIYQELSLCPHLSVEENILLGMEPSTAGILRRREIRRRAREGMERLGIGQLDPQHGGKLPSHSNNSWDRPPSPSDAEYSSSMSPPTASRKPTSATLRWSPLSKRGTRHRLHLAFPRRSEAGL
jgi:ABC-type glutathione transport system ATPase component